MEKAQSVYGDVVMLVFAQCPDVKDLAMLMVSEVATIRTTECVRTDVL